jgi:hypothetical protein
MIPHDGGLCVDGQRLDHARASCIQVNRAMNIQPVPPAVLFGRDFGILGRPAPGGPHGVRGVRHRISP